MKSIDSKQDRWELVCNLCTLREEPVKKEINLE
jgi:hypothetical protein